jgi:asparagine synthase (glutamine-hydrolysing)
MCGIIGYVSLSGENAAVEKQDAIRSVLKQMKLRGPDGNGIAGKNNWIFGHTRLAIIDPKAGQQPWTDDESGATLTYNGEIYNFRELREILKARGYAFKTDCDTELVLAAYLEWGEKCVEKFNGFFAFAIMDPQKNRLFAARDRIGIKPFYYSISKQGFCFSSVVPGIMICKKEAYEPDLEAVSHYLTTGKVLFGERTLIKGIKTLRPGESISLDIASGAMNKRRYWSRPVFSPAEKMSMAIPFKSAVEKTKELLEDSIKKRLMSDVPLGSFLSGGLDSSIIASAARRHSHLALPLFCAGTDNEKENEFQFAEELAKQLQCHLYEVKVSPDDFSKDWGFLLSQKGLPLSTPNEISIFHLSAALRNQCVVTLTGEGADEIFGGYVQPHFSAYDFDRCPRDAESAKNTTAFEMSMTMLYGRNFFLNDTDHYTATSCWFTFLEKTRLFNSSAWEELDEDNAMFSFYEDFFDSVEKCSSFDKRMHLHAEFNLENLLNRIDNSSMCASVEARVPFNDHRLVEFAFAMPDTYKMDWATPEAEKHASELTAFEIDRQNLLETKRLPRRAFYDDLPRDIIERKKMSFPVPFQEWFHGPLLEETRELCLNSDFSKTYFNETEAQELLKNKSRNLWIAANLCKWWETIKNPVS